MTSKKLFKLAFRYKESDCTIVCDKKAGIQTAKTTIKRNLRVLANSPDLREELGRAGRNYVEKYHSYETAQFVFGAR
ncbi:MAG: hypothetical protein P8X84_00995 [Candidatus Bathyarchaeota archaeon]